MAAVYAQRMSGGMRLAIFAIFGALWVSGGCWLGLHLFFREPTAFGPVDNPWLPQILRIHGWLAVAAVFLSGWIMARHVSDRWPGTVKRVSGVAVASVVGVLALSGYALYYTLDRTHEAAAVVHEVVGVAALLFALVHWRRHKSQRRDISQRATSVPTHSRSHS